jgi:hypothetical protein
VTDTVFLVPAGSTIPTNIQNIGPTNTIEAATIKVSQILTSCTPTPSVLIVGTIVSNPAGIFPSAAGAPVAISVGYTTDNPPKVNNVVVVVAGQVVTYSAGATGAFGVTTPSGGGSNGGGGGTGTGPQAVIDCRDCSTIAALNGVNTYQVSQSPVTLTASRSTGTGLTYMWSTSSNTPVAFVNTGDPAVVQVQFPSAGGYVITLTVTDASGNKNSETVFVEYTGRPR